MNSSNRQQRKSYGMLRMSRAISRAISAATPHEQDRAGRWVAAWGLIGGIRSDTVRLRDPQMLKAEPEAPQPAPALETPAIVG